MGIQAESSSKIGFLEEMVPGLSPKQRLCVNQVIIAGPMKPHCLVRVWRRKIAKTMGKEKHQKKKKSSSVIQRDMKK